MAGRIAELIESFDGVGIVSRYDRATGTWIFICLDDDTLGAASGGTRMRRYAEPADGLLDAMRLGRGMTHKWAALGLPFGGGKAVLAVDRLLDGRERRGLLERYGSLLQSLGGIFATGEDLGTTPEDFEIIARRTRYVHGFHPETGDKIDPGPFTARGVFAGIQAGARRALGGDLAGRSVLVQGAGHVGGCLAELLQRAGASVLVADLDQQLASAVASRVGGTVVAADETYDTDCDIYAPCAVGATLDATTIPRLRCRLVAGSANNQLAAAEDAERLHRRRIVYAPDFIVNAGGALAFALLGGGESDFDLLYERMSEIGRTLDEVLEEAEAHDESPVAAANRRVARTLEQARSADSKAR